MYQFDDDDDADRDDVTLLVHTVVSLEHALLCDHHFMERLMIDLSS